MKTEILMACDQFVTAALNSLAAGILLAMFVGWSLRALGQTNAATRHLVWFGTLLLLVGLVPAQWWHGRLDWGQGNLIAAPAGERGGLLASSPPDAPAELQISPPAAAAPGQAEWSPTLAILESANEQLDSFSSFPLRPTTWASRLAMFLNPASWHLELGSVLPRGAGVVLLALWMAVAGFKVHLLLWRLIGLRKLKRSSLPASAELDALFRCRRAKLAVSREVRLRISPAQRSAVVLGFFHPVILFPVEESRNDLQAAEHVLDHELAHVRRFDDWANLLQQMIQAVLFFHPAVWWVSKRLALEREIACDDFVLQQGRRPQAYALLLVNLAGRRTGRQQMLAPGVSTGKRQLQQRIDMILNAHRNTSPRLAKTKLGFITAATVLVALLVLYAGPRLVLAQNLTPSAVPGDAAGASVSVASAGSQPGDPAAPSAAAAVQVKAVPTVQVDAVAVPALQIDFAQADPAAPGTPAHLEPGPRFKPAQSPSEEALPAPAPAPEPRKPRPARPPRLAEGAASGSSVEDRLDRLERMVKSLMAQQNTKRERPELSEQERSEARQFASSKEAELKAGADAKRESVRAAEVDKRALKQAERAMKMEEKWREKAQQDGMQSQLEALRQQREVLQREMQKLQSQIERIAREHQRLDSEKQRHGAEGDNEPKER